MYEQNQGNATLSRLITAVARAAGLNPIDLAAKFIDEAGGREFVEKFNESTRVQFAEKKEAEEAELKAKEESLKPKKDDTELPTESREAEEEPTE